LHVTIAQAIDSALKLHEAGKLADAEAIYQQILAREPGNSDALHLLGVLMHQKGNTVEGIALVERALRVSRDPTYLANLGELLRCAGNLERGMACCREAIEHSPRLASAWQNLAVLLNQAERLEEALTAARKAVELAPDDPSSRRILSGALASLGQTAEAITHAEAAIRSNPSDSKAWSQLAVAHEAAGRVDHAIFCLRNAVHAAPHLPDPLQRLTQLLVHRGRYAEGLGSLQRLVTLTPETVDLQLNRARCLEGLNQFAPAIAICQSVLEKEPTNIVALGVIANARIQSCRLADAEAGVRDALKVSPSANLYQILSAALARQGRLDEAVAAINRAIELEPDYAVAHFSKALILLFGGRMEEAWPGIEYRWKHPQMDGWRHDTDKPTWDGSPLNGKRILLFSEQGLGDTIHFGRYATLVARRGGRVILEVQKGLQDVMRTIQGVERVVVRGDPVGEFDTLAPLLSLSGIFKTSLQTIPATVPYISVAQAKIEQWRRIIGDAAGKRKIGIAWMGGDFQRENHLRSTTLAAFAPLADVPNVRFYSLQKGPTAKEALFPPPGMDLIDLDPFIRDFSDTAAAIQNLDLVISIDTSVVHVAGALGKPVWTLLHPNIGHMWMTKREDSPWYPTMRLFRQPTAGDWQSLMARVAAELQVFLKRRDEAATRPVATGNVHPLPPDQVHLVPLGHVHPWGHAHVHGLAHA
jgi:tetratricopeptide (TPR) repeat protein